MKTLSIIIHTLLLFNIIFISSIEDEHVVKRQKVSTKEDIKILPSNRYEPFDNSDYVIRKDLNKLFLQKINGAIFFLKKVKEQTYDNQLLEIFDFAIEKIKKCSSSDIREIKFLLKELLKNQDLDEQIATNISCVITNLNKLYEAESHYIGDTIGQIAKEQSNQNSEYNFPLDCSDLVMDYLSPGEYEELVVIKNEVRIDQIIFYDNYKKLLIRGGDQILNWDLETKTLISEAIINRGIKSITISEDGKYIFCSFEKYIFGRDFAHYLLILNNSLEELDCIKIKSDNMKNHNIMLLGNMELMYLNDSHIIGINTNLGIIQFEVQETGNRLKLNRIDVLHSQLFSKLISSDKSKEVKQAYNINGHPEGFKINYLQRPIVINATIKGYYNFAWSNDSSKLACVDKSGENMIFIWDSKVIDKFLRLNFNESISYDIEMFWSPDDKCLAIINCGLLKFFNTLTGQKIKKIENRYNATNMQWIDNNRFAVIYGDEVKIYGKTF